MSQFVCKKCGASLRVEIRTSMAQSCSVEDDGSVNYDPCCDEPFNTEVRIVCESSSSEFHQGRATGFAWDVDIDGQYRLVPLAAKKVKKEEVPA